MAAPVTQTGFRDGGKTSEAGIHRITRALYTREGVILSGDLQVTQNGTPDNNVLIATGDIIIGTTSPYTTFPPYFYHSWVATSGLVAIAANASGSARIDAIVAYIDLTVVSSASNDNPGALKFADVQGTPAGSPVAPTDAAIQSAVGASNPWVLLAVVAVANGFASIVNANITDCRPLADVPTTIDTDQSKPFVATGFVWAATSGLSAANSAGRAYLALTGGGGRSMYKPAITHLFTASKDTYVDLPPTAKATQNDDFTYTPVTNGAAAPALAAGSIRLAKVVTSGAAVTSVTTSGKDSLGNQFMPRPIGTNQIELLAITNALMNTDIAPYTNNNEAHFDYVASGCVWTADGPGTTLNASMTSGVVYILGVRLTVAAVTARAFTLSTDTYVYLTNNGDGTAAFTYTTAVNNAASPSAPANSVLIAIVVAGATFITSTAASINQGQESKILPIASSIAYSVTDSLGNLICPRDPSRRILGYRQILSAFSTAATTATQVPGLTCPVIVPTARKIKASVGTDYLNNTTANGNAFVTIWDGVVAVGTQIGLAKGFSVSIGSVGNAATPYAITTPAATSKTYNTGLHASGGGTAVIDAAATTAASLLLELA